MFPHPTSQEKLPDGQQDQDLVFSNIGPDLTDAWSVLTK